MVTAELEFRLVGGANPLILVPTFVNGRGPYDFILDTGAGQCLVTPELAATLRIQALETKEAAGAGGRVKVQFGEVDSIAVGGAQSDKVRVAVTDELHRVGSAVGARIDGDLGYSFLRNFRLTIDYKNSSLRLETRREGLARYSHAQSIAFKLASPAKPLILLPVIVNGAGPFQFALDTGSSTTVLSPPLAQQLKISTAEVQQGTGAGGKVSMAAGKISAMTVGAKTLHNLDIVSGDFLTMISAVAGAKLEGIVGYNFLREFAVTIDYPQSQLLLEAGR